ncbi:hypothetical protein PG993_011361 [Apiospora rasikravindrae]|uniref:Uncharacterized protein n=1 Tax=Apiospora rasikravindrae TaxID=990691 RepID=A0ABR1SE23_9PEZI
MPPLPPPVANTHGIELPARYRICLLTDEYTDWVKALYSDGFLLRATPWVAMNRTAPPGRSRVNLALSAFTELDGFHRYLVNSGLSYAIFDTEYAFQRPGSAEAGGHLYWDDGGVFLGQHEHQRQQNRGDYDEDEEDDAKVNRLVEGMDFPLVCYGLSYDAFAPYPAETQKIVNAFYPLRGPMFEYIDQHLDKRPRDHPDRQPPTRPREILMRNGCITKRGYEGRGLMTALNRFIALEARARGFRGLSLGTNSPTVMRSYFFNADDEKKKGKNPMAAAGMRSSVFAHVDNLGQFRLSDFGIKEENGIDGKEVYPFRGYWFSQKVWLIWCDLAPLSPSSPPR